MGQKVHPNGFRIGVIRGWQSKWFSEKEYTKFVGEDLVLRQAIMRRFPDAAISSLEIDRASNQVAVTIHTARPGIIIGRGGQRVDELRQALEALTSRRVRLNIQEIRMPELDAQLVARSIGDQLQRRVAYRRAIRQSITRTMERGALGIKIAVSGRLGGAEIARREKAREGRVPLHTLRADIDYGFAEAATTFGRIGVKVWIYKRDIFPERSREEALASAMAGTSS